MPRIPGFAAEREKGDCERGIRCGPSPHSSARTAPQPRAAWAAATMAVGIRYGEALT